VVQWGVRQLDRQQHGERGHGRKPGQHSISTEHQFTSGRPETAKWRLSQCGSNAIAERWSGQR
jgi:hypothetical protein